jgi:hypothetical protein
MRKYRKKLQRETNQTGIFSGRIKNPDKTNKGIRTGVTILVTKWGEGIQAGKTRVVELKENVLIKNSKYLQSKCQEQHRDSLRAIKLHT